MTQVQYYQFGFENSSVQGGVPQGLSGCSTNISIPVGDSVQQQGNDPNNPNNFMAVYPGESVTVCHTDVSPIGQPTEFIAYLAAPGVIPAGLSRHGQPRYVALCGSDGVPVTSPAFGGQGTMAAAVSETTGNSPIQDPNSTPLSLIMGCLRGHKRDHLAGATDQWRFDARCHRQGRIFCASQ